MLSAALGLVAIVFAIIALLIWLRLLETQRCAEYEEQRLLKNNAYLGRRVDELQIELKRATAKLEATQGTLHIARDLEADRLDGMGNNLACYAEHFYAEAKKIRKAAQDRQSPGDAPGGEETPGTTERAA